MLRRHQLVRLNEGGWTAVRAGAWDDEARACLSFWAAERQPLVVTQQPARLPEGHVALGLSAPLRWNRRRLAMQVPMSGILFFDEFPKAAAITALLPPSLRSAWAVLASELTARVYGSYGWQRLTGLDYVHADSDIDLCVSVDDAASADRVVAALSEAAQAAFARPRLDGELVFPDGRAVAWREWLPWREQRVDRILVKRLQGVAMERALEPC
ncbi:MAG: malonate decarboxylase holo-[acyl-carrier-protein] synthase [Microbacteriaceae bacterium]|nr:malonate decarboxylase holo-[acyl-carrier-protein] synthase [Burkholderiaceae bacterium]